MKIVHVFFWAIWSILPPSIFLLIIFGFLNVDSIHKEGYKYVTADTYGMNWPGHNFDEDPIATPDFLSLFGLTSQLFGLCIRNEGRYFNYENNFIDNFQIIINEANGLRRKIDTNTGDQCFIFLDWSKLKFDSSPLFNHSNISIAPISTFIDPMGKEVIGQRLDLIYEVEFYIKPRSQHLYYLALILIFSIWWTFILSLKEIVFAGARIYRWQLDRRVVKVSW